MFFPLRGSLNREVIFLFGTVTTSTAGAIASQTGKGFAVARTSAGLYTITLSDIYASLFQTDVSLRAATVTPGAGQLATVSSVDLGAQTITVKIYRPDTQVVADVDDGAVISISFLLSNVPL